MSSDSGSATAPLPQREAQWRNVTALAMLLLAVLALVAPLGKAAAPGRVGFLLVLTGMLEILHGFRRSSTSDQRAAWGGGIITVGMGWLLLHSPYFAAAGLVLLLAGWFALDGVRHFASLFRRQGSNRSAAMHALMGTANFAVAVALLAAPRLLSSWAIAIAAAARIFAAASNVALAQVFTESDSGENVLDDLQLKQPELVELADRIAKEENLRGPIDRGWIVGLLFVLLAIHVGRMGFDRTFVGVVAPGVAVLGDAIFSLALAFLIVIPTGVFWRRTTRWPERRVWGWCLEGPQETRGWARRFALTALGRRLRMAIRLKQARYSFRAALRRGLQTGLPLAAIIAATAPTFGLSWYFDTENWAAGMWNSWAEERTDDWRQAMIRAELADNPSTDFAVHPPGIREGEDFSFIVIGDTGEGDASQHSLRAAYLEVVRRPDVKFVVISSDVVYPIGAMRDYEWKFWLPFMGTDKPVYAIPGNHDWYDANEAFNATFLKPESARRAMRARLNLDQHISTTTDRRIDELIAQASRLRKEYGVPTQNQQGPFFQFQTESFALIAVDTGVRRQIDPLQRAWLEQALESSKGKMTMAILGHPLYAGGNLQTEEDPEFAAIHELLRRHQVSIVMAGDTHDLEHYVERDAGGKPAHHFVNGGGGAYLSYGTALAFPAEPAVPEWAFYPSKKQVVEKIDAVTPWWKRPAWWWTRDFGAYPFSAEWVSALFDTNYAPFHQSFCEIRVEPSKGQIRVIPFGVHGRLRWSDFETSPQGMPQGANATTFVEWAIPARR